MSEEIQNINKKELESAQSLWKIIFSQFIEHRLAVVGTVVISFFIFISLTAPILASIIGHNPDDQNVFHRYQAPMTVVTINGVEKTHILGTDELGRDVLVRLIYGTRVSLGVGILVALASSFIGLIIGCLAGFYGGFWDALLMRITDSLLSLPLLPVLIVMAAIDFTKAPLLKHIITQQNQAVLKLVIILCIFSWMWVARLVRGSILSLKEREFIMAARTLGASDFTIMVRHIIPNVIAPLLVSVTLGVGESILFEAALSYLGLGIQPPTPSWGNMLFNAQEMIHEAPGLAILPGLLILATTISFNYIGDGLQDAIDPKAIRR
jgi:peptide/nickel transport system permease protein